MNRAFKQIVTDPADWPLMGVYWQGAIFFDTTTMMGSRSAPYCCQQSTTFIRHVMCNIGYFVANYVDDFMGLDKEPKIQYSYEAFGRLLRDLGVNEAEDKAVPPNEIIEFLGVLFNFLNMTIGVTEERKTKILLELRTWKHKKTTSRTQLESLIGKLQFITNCVRPGRVMMWRLRETMKHMEPKGRHIIDQECLKDVQWWAKFLPIYDSVSIMWMVQEPKPDKVIASDACLQGMGANYGKQYVYSEFPQPCNTDAYLIVHLELLALIVALKIWKREIQGIRFVVLCNNMAVVEVVNSG